MIRPAAFLRRLSKCILPVLFLVGAVAAQAVGTATVDLTNAIFGKGIDVHLTSGTTAVPAASSYDYAITGTVHGTGLLAGILPVGTQLSALLERLQSGSSSVLRGTQPNPNGTLPTGVVDQTFSGSFPIAIGLNVTGSLRIVGRITGTGQIRFHIVNVDFSLPGFANLGTVVFEPGSQVVVSVKPVVEFRVPAESVRENAGALVVRVRRKLNNETSVTVHYSSAPATATASDFVAVSGDLTFAPGEGVKTFPVTIKNRPGTQGSRIFRLRLSAPAGAVIGPNSRDVVTINDAP